jgi:hypothetical protein
MWVAGGLQSCCHSFTDEPSHATDEEESVDEWRDAVYDREARSYAQSIGGAGSTAEARNHRVAGHPLSREDVSDDDHARELQLVQGPHAVEGDMGGPSRLLEGQPAYEHGEVQGAVDGLLSSPPLAHSHSARDTVRVMTASLSRYVAHQRKVSKLLPYLVQKARSQDCAPA